MSRWRIQLESVVVEPVCCGKLEWVGIWGWMRVRCVCGRVWLVEMGWIESTCLLPTHYPPSHTIPTMASQTTRTDREHDPERRLVGEFMQVDAAEGLLRIGPHEVQRL